MFRLFIIFAFVTIALSGTAIAQTAAETLPSPTPAPTPVKRRPMLDQFGTGAFANIGATSPTSSAEPITKLEYIDQDTFEILVALTEKAEFLETELRRALGENVDISPSSRFRKYFDHHIEGILNVSAMQRTGSLGGAGIKSGELTKLLLQNEKSCIEILAVLDAGAAEYARFSKELNGVSVKYGIPLLENASSETRLDKPMLLKKIMAQMNTNFARVKRQMAVKK